MGAKRFLKRVTLRKAATTGATFLGLFVAGMATVEIPADPSALDKALPAIGIAVAGAAWRAYRNMRKNPELSGNPLAGPNVPSGYMLVVAGLAAALSGCVTTTAPDGTVTQQLDPVALETAWATWERYEARRVELERQKREADAEERARLEAELRRLEPEIVRLAERLGL
jgi:hypothetical protein